MPELPEVETIKRVIAPQIVGCKIKTITFGNTQVIAYPSAELFAEKPLQVWKDEGQTYPLYLILKTVCFYIFI